MNRNYFYKFLATFIAIMFLGSFSFVTFTSASNTSPYNTQKHSELTTKETLMAGLITEYYETKDDPYRYRTYLSKDKKWYYNEFPNRYPDGVFVTGSNTKETELTTPKTIDGKKVIGTGGGSNWFEQNPSIKRLILKNNIKVIDCSGFNLQNTGTRQTIREVVFSEGLETIKGDAAKYTHVDKWIFPRSLKLIEANSFGWDGSTNSFKQIFFKGNPVLKDRAIAISNLYDPKNKKVPVEIYFEDDATNASEYAFAYWVPDPVIENDNNFCITKDVTVYRIPGSKGFEKFKNAGYTVNTISKAEMVAKEKQASIETDVTTLISTAQNSTTSVKATNQTEKDNTPEFRIDKLVIAVLAVTAGLAIVVVITFIIKRRKS